MELEGTPKRDMDNHRARSKRAAKWGGGVGRELKLEFKTRNSSGAYSQVATGHGSGGSGLKRLALLPSQS